MAMRRVIGSFKRLGLPCRPAMLHGGSVGEAEVNSSKLKSESGMPADGEEVVACWSEDEASYSEAVVKAERCESDSAIVEKEDGSTVYVSQEVCTVSLDNQNHAKERLQAATIKRLERKEAREECQPVPA